MLNVLAIIPDDFGRVLLVRYTEHSNWTLPGGDVDESEDPKQSLARLVLEISGLVVSVEQLFDNFKYSDKPDDPGISYQSFICKEAGGVLTITRPELQFGEFDENSLPSSLEPVSRNQIFNFWQNPTVSTAVLQDHESVQPLPPENLEPIILPSLAPIPEISLTQEERVVKIPPAEPAVVKQPFKPVFGQPLLSPWPFVIAFAVLALYFITRRGNFLADDFIILNQLHFKQNTLLDNLGWFGRDWGVGVNFYRPWVRLVYYFEFAIFKDNPAGWHLISTGLHLFNSVLVYLLAWLLVSRKTAAVAAGMLFALLPIHSEPVSWISGQTDLWAAFFSLGSASAYIRASQRQSQKRPYLLLLGLALFLFTFGLFSKESAIVLPLALLAYHFIWGVSGWATPGKKNPGVWSKSLLRVVLFQFPFWVLLVLYFGLRFMLFNGLGGYTPEAGIRPDLGLFLKANLRWLAFPFNFSGTDGWILLVVMLAFLLLTGVQEWERFRWLNGKIRQEQALSGSESKAASFQTRPAFWSLRTAAYGIIWAAIFLLPAALTPPAERFTYLPSAGSAIFLAVCLAPFNISPTSFNLNFFERFNRLKERTVKRKGTVPQNRQIRDGALKQVSRTELEKKGANFDLTTFLRISALVVVLCIYFGTGAERVRNWIDAGYTADKILKLTKEVIPGVVHYSVFVSKGIPDSGTNSLIFRTGYPDAVQILYNDPTLEIQRADEFPILVQKLDRTIFLEYEGDRLINHQEVTKTLLDRNAHLKNEKEFLNWDFSNPSQGEGTSYAASRWFEKTGGGRAVVQNGKLVLTGTGPALLQSPTIGLPAVQLGSLEIRFKASGELQAGNKINAKWETLANAEPRDFPSVSVEVIPDGQYHTYRIMPPVGENYNYNDTIGDVQLQFPGGLENVSIELVRQNTIITPYTELEK